jgi:O-Antigen ligase
MNFHFWKSDFLLFSLLFGFVLFPHVGILGLLLLNLCRNARVEISNFIPIFAWTIVRVIFHWRVNNDPFVGLFEGLLMLLLSRGASVINSTSWISRIPFALICGLIVSIIYSVSFPLQLQSRWFSEHANINWNLSHTVLYATPVKSNDAYFYRQFYSKSAGIFAYEVELRSSKPQEILILVSSLSLSPRFSSPNKCDLDYHWKNCKISVYLPRPGNLSLIIGGFGSWRLGDPTIELRNARVIEGNVSTPFDIIKSAPRAAGFTFNANAFGLTTCLLSLLVILVNRSFYVRFSVVILALTAILLSGSRTSFVTFAVGALVCTVLEVKKVYVRKLLMLLICVLSASLIFTTSLSSFGRALGGIDVDRTSNLQRIYQFEMAIRAFKQSPIVGVGDLREYMVKNLDESANHIGLDANQVAHAHNLIAQTAGESGVLGLLGILLLWTTVFIRILNRRDFSSLLLLSIIFIINLFDLFFYFPTFQVVFWIISENSLTPKAFQIADQS